MIPVSAQTKDAIGRFRSARDKAVRELASDPRSMMAWSALGDALCGLRRHREAIASYDKALALVPDATAIWKRREQAVRGGRKTMDLSEPDAEPVSGDSKAWTRRAGFLLASERFAEAAAASDRALEVNPKNSVALRMGVRARLSACDWSKREEDERRVAEAVKAGKSIIAPFVHRAFSESEAANFAVAQLFWKAIPKPAEGLWRGERYRHDRIRVAYLSAEFRDHPISIQIAGVFEHHDRTRFDTTAVSLSGSPPSKMRRRLESAFDRFVHAQSMSDPQIARTIRELEIDILVDLNGHAGAARPGIITHRPAPVCVSYHGTTATLGTSFVDYIIADSIVIPDEHVRYYTEQVVYLPECFQCNDSRRYLPQDAVARADVGLPENAFVYCCFNNTYKITPAVFDIWMRLLKARPGAVLWLLADSAYAIRNLHREATSRGVSPERIIFAPRVPVDDHLSRLRLGDLFLDTLPVNAHATASDALWVGLPVVTCLGSTFAGRVGGSVLRAIGLPELVTSSLDEYETLARSLAQDNGRLAAIRAKLIHNRNTEPLFDTARLTRFLESAYSRMWERQQAGLPPESFVVPAAQVGT